MLFGFFLIIAGQTVRKKYTTKIFRSIPAILINANFFGLFSCLSFAKGKALKASKPIITAQSVMYSEWSGSPMNLAMDDLKNMVNPIITSVEISRDVLSVS